MFDLKVATDSCWVRIVMDNFDEFLADHADCERKASSMALNMIVKCPEQQAVIQPLIDLALEELTHFRQVYAILIKRGISLNRRMHPDPYVNQLIAHCRSGLEYRLMDKMLAMAIVEARGAERFGIIAETITNPELKGFYRGLHVAETKHGSLFLKLCLKCFDSNVVYGRFEEMLEIEAKIIQSVEWRPSLH